MSEFKGKTKNLGLCAGMVSSAKAPSNKKVLWYDETVTSGCPIKYYDLSINEWTNLKD